MRGSLLPASKVRISNPFGDMATFPTRLGLIAALLLAASPAAAQTSTAVGELWAPITAAGVEHASALVDSVYVDRLLPRAVVPGGDFSAYLMARLGMRVLPPDFGFKVAIDTGLIRIGGRISDLPAEARQALSQLVLMLPAQTRLEAQVELLPAGREAVRFHLRSATVDGVAIPEILLVSLMGSVGKQYPALTETGRDLYVQIPAGAGVRLVPGAVLLTGP